MNDDNADWRASADGSMCLLLISGQVPAYLHIKRSSSRAAYESKQWTLRQELLCTLTMKNQTLQPALQPESAGQEVTTAEGAVAHCKLA